MCQLQQLELGLLVIYAIGVKRKFLAQAKAGRAAAVCLPGSTAQQPAGLLQPCPHLCSGLFAQVKCNGKTAKPEPRELLFTMP